MSKKFNTNKETSTSKEINTYQESKLQGVYPVLHQLFGIYVDWQIDNNLHAGLGHDPHGIRSFSDFLNQKRWQVVEIRVDGQSWLALNLLLPKFKLLEMLKFEVVSVKANKLAGRDAELLLARWQKKRELPLFNILSYYLANTPWILVDPAAYQTPSKPVLSLDAPSKRIIIKVMTQQGEERITSANDLLDGEVIESEILIDPTHYDDETSYEAERLWSEKLGIPVLSPGEPINFQYVFPKS